MLGIRTDQIEIFEEPVLLQFEDEMVEHLKTYAPKLFEIRGESCFRQVVQRGIKKAMRYGFTNRGPIRFYLETMVAFGTEFDTDPQIPGVAQVLRNPDKWDQMAHAEKLFELISEFVEKTKGPKNQWAIQALQQLHHSDLFTRPFDSDGLTPALVSLMQRTYPEKGRYVGEKRLRTLIWIGTTQAEEYAVNTPQGIVLLTSLMFAMGHGVTRDPLYPWVNHTLTDPKYEQPDERVDHLKSKTKIYLEATLKHLAA